MQRNPWMAAAAALCLAALPAAASTFVGLTDRELVAGADALIQGQVTELRSSWSEDGRAVVTDVVVKVEERVFGEAPQLVTVRTFGGQVGDFRVEAEGFPRFAEGERVLLFVKRDDSDGTLRVHGYQQGQYRVVTRLDGVTLAVPMLDEGVRLLRPDGKALPEPQSVQIDTFKTRAREIAKRARRADLQK